MILSTYFKSLGQNFVGYNFSIVYLSVKNIFEPTYSLDSLNYKDTFVSILDFLCKKVIFVKG